MNITPESFFRICDTKYDQEFDYQTFRDYVALFKLEISDAQVNRILSIMDEDKNGMISISEYYSTLEAYNVRGEVIGPFDDDPSSIKFEH